MKRMLFNATQPEELRVAIVDGQRLIDLDIESTRKEQRKSNIYKGVVTRVEPSLEAAFVDYGVDRHGFLPFKEISRQYLRGESGEAPRGRVVELLREGHELVVQVDKDERGSKGAALTTYISLAGRYLVLMPNNPRGGGVSRRVEGEDRAELREVMNNLELPEGMSTIARTAGIGRSAEELQWDLNYLLRLWEAIDSAAGGLKAPQLLYRESNLVIRAIRDLYHPDIAEILIDSPAIHKDAMDFVRLVIPGSAPKVKLYQDEVPLFSRFQIEHQIETAYRREVALPSGGAVVIDKTEALAAIDVNSARATKGADIEQTALNTNLEAADEIARQLRLRDLGGLIVVDFIDMENPRNQREVENRFREALKYDRARVQTGKISRFGMMELSRQRLQGSIAEGSHSTCPRCSGTGQIRDVPSSSLHILRLLGEEAMKDNTAMVRALVPVAVATYLLNEKRAELTAMEQRMKLRIMLLPTPALETPHFQVERVRPDEMGREDIALPSYEMAAALPAEEEEESPRGGGSSEARPAQRQQPIVKGVTPDQPAPITAPEMPAAAPAVKISFFSRLLGWFKPPTPSESAQSPSQSEAAAQQREPRRGEQRRRGRPERERGDQRDQRGPREQVQARAEGQRSDQRRERTDQRREGSERGQDRGDRGGRDRQRGERQQRPQEARNDQRGQQQRPQHPPRPERESAATAEAGAVQNAETVTSETGDSRRGRNRRGGRRGEGQRGEHHQGAHRSEASRQESSSQGAGPARREPRPQQREEAPREEPATAASAEHTQPFVPTGDRIVTNAVSLPALLAGAANSSPAAETVPASVQQPRVEREAARAEAPLAARVPATPTPPLAAPLPLPELGELQMVTTRAAAPPVDQQSEGNGSMAQRHRPRRRPRPQAQGPAELVMVETASAPAPADTEMSDEQRAHHARRQRSQRSGGTPSEPLVQIETGQNS